MPSSATITSSSFVGYSSMTTFSSGTVIRSSPVNANFSNTVANFSVWRGHLLPVDPTVSASADNTYDLGSSEYSWRKGYVGALGDVKITTGSFTLSKTDIIAVFSGTATGTFTLPSAASLSGHSILIKTSQNTTSVNLTVDGNGSETIDDTVTASVIGYNNSLHIVSDGTNWKAIKKHYIPPSVQRFTSGVSQTYSLPTNPRPVYLKVKIVGGGGGGGGSGTGNDGNNTTFGTSLLTAYGGGGAAAATSGGYGGAGGTITAAAPALAVIAQVGQRGQGVAQEGAVAADGNSPGGFGGNSALGGGGTGAQNQAGQAGSANSGGGGAGGGTDGSGVAVFYAGSGGGGGGYIEAIITNPSGTYLYTVGTGGSAGSAGTGGSAGGAGADGMVVVEEYYS